MGETSWRSSLKFRIHAWVRGWAIEYSTRKNEEEKEEGMNRGLQEKGRERKISAMIDQGSRSIFVICMLRLPSWYRHYLLEVLHKTYLLNKVISILSLYYIRKTLETNLLLVVLIDLMIIKNVMRAFFFYFFSYTETRA